MSSWETNNDHIYNDLTYLQHDYTNPTTTMDYIFGPTVYPENQNQYQATMVPTQYPHDIEASSSQINPNPMIENFPIVPAIDFGAPPPHPSPPRAPKKKYIKWLKKKFQALRAKSKSFEVPDLGEPSARDIHPYLGESVNNAIPLLLESSVRLEDQLGQLSEKVDTVMNLNNTYMGKVDYLENRNKEIEMAYNSVHSTYGVFCNDIQTHNNQIAALEKEGGYNQERWEWIDARVGSVEKRTDNGDWRANMAEGKTNSLADRTRGVEIKMTKMHDRVSALEGKPRRSQ